MDILTLENKIRAKKRVCFNITQSEGLLKDKNVFMEVRFPENDKMVVVGMDLDDQNDSYKRLFRGTTASYNENGGGGYVLNR